MRQVARIKEVRRKLLTRMTMMWNFPKFVFSANFSVVGYCLSSGDYKFTMTDLFKDGMCCASGNGRYTGYVDGTKRFSSPSDNSDWGTQSHPFSVATNSDGSSSGNNLSDLPFDSKITSTTDRDNEWLVAHNTRRQKWHQRYGKTYVPLAWSNALKELSKEYAEKLLAASCGELIHG